jgi:ribosomal protein S1
VNPITVSLDDISEQDEVTGTVVRVSNYGVFIDIGAGVDAFLHRRKMKVN